MIGQHAYEAVVAKLTGKQRDSESGLNNFGARYFSSNLGRFTIPDPKARSARKTDPQSWNRYAYTLNNPLKFVDADGMDVVLAASLSQKDRSYVVQNLARLYATPAGRVMLERADQSKFTIEVGTAKLGRTELAKAPPGTVVFGGQIKVEGGITRYGTATAEGHTILVGHSAASPTAPPIQVLIDPAQSAEIGKDPGKVFAHEVGGHLADAVKAAESNPNQFIDGVDPNSEVSSKAAEKAVGKLPGKASPEDVRAVEELLKRKRETDRE